ncbi:DUF4921 family protein [Corynebacterium sp. 35RC1]|nr:DUF4921 family protein [Corynebacterium sp. 35RC1]
MSKSFLQKMPDGTVKQLNPFSGTQAWTVTGRGNRPLGLPVVDPKPLDPQDHVAYCAFCQDRMLETPPEKARMVGGQIVTGVMAEDLGATQADFRRVANLFEIVTYEYWQANYGYHMPEELERWFARYVGTSQGLEHVLRSVGTKRKASGRGADAPQSELLAQAAPFFGGGHDLIIGRRHFIDGATDDSQLAGSGTLHPDEHAELIAFTVASTKALYAQNRYAPYVAVFQNWLKPAGASFDHLHKQLVAIDERGRSLEDEIAKLRQNPNMYNEWAVDYAASQNLIIAENEHAILFAGFGHRYPTLEVYSKSATSEPWLQSPEEVRAMSDLIHAAHAAAGPDVPCNEEWHHKPADLDMPMPWRVMIKWRVSNLAGFEGGTKIHVNTLSPWDVRDRVVDTMYALRNQEKIARNILIATECKVERNSLRYNPFLYLR